MFNRVLIREYNFHPIIYFFFPFPGGGDPGGGILGLASMSNLETAQVQIKLRQAGGKFKEQVKEKEQSAGCQPSVAAVALLAAVTPSLLPRRRHWRHGNDPCAVRCCYQ